ncbi:MAG: aldehyde dehydrogenase family protein, partial [Bacteroidota bacterium]
MKQPDQEMVAEIVDAVLARLNIDAGGAARIPSAPHGTSPQAHGCVFEDVDDAVEATRRAQRVWAETSRETKGRVIAALRKAMHENAEEFARGALEETGMGRYEDKLLKHHQAADATPGLEDLDTRSWAGDKGRVYED